MDALEGLVVLDITSGIAGPYTTKLLADLGARVIKIERPGGDPSRSQGPFLADEPGPERSGTYQFLNTNKESIVVDLDAAESREILEVIGRRADLIVTGLPVPTAHHLGLDPGTLQALTGRSVLSISNFGQGGPYRDYRLSDTVLFAMGGEMYSHGVAEREPLKAGGTATLLQAGAYAAIAAMGALLAWERHGTVQQVDVPLFDVQVVSTDRRSACIMAYRFAGRVQERLPGGVYGAAGGVYPCSDGYVEVSAAFGDYFQRFARMIGDPTLEEPRWRDTATHADPSARAEVDAIAYPWMLARTRREVWAEARRVHAMVAPLFTATDLAEDPVFRARGLWAEVEHEVLGRFEMLGRPYALDRTPWRIRRRAPILGEHTDRLLGEAGFARQRVRQLRAAGVIA